MLAADAAMVACALTAVALIVLLGPVLPLLGTAAGALGFALAPLPAVAVVAGFVEGAGLAMFIAHSGPVLVRCAPPEQLSRMQSLLGVVQAGTLVGTNVAVGALATGVGPGAALLTVAAALAAAGVWAATRRALDDGPARPALSGRLRAPPARRRPR